MMKNERKTMKKKEVDNSPSFVIKGEDGESRFRNIRSTNKWK